jgi:hypothetical protein
MQANHQLAFLQEKISDLGSAIFFNLSDSVLKLPTSIITTQKVDEYGFIWFYMQKPKQDLREFEKEFPVRLDFFRKGKDYFLQVTGKAWLVADPEEMNSMELGVEEMKAVEQMILVKVKMLKADYHETQMSTRSSWWQNTVNYVQTWFGSSNGVYGREVFHPAS